MDSPEPSLWLRPGDYGCSGRLERVSRATMIGRSQDRRTLDSGRATSRRQRNAATRIEYTPKELQTFGDRLLPKSNHLFRIGFQNFGGFRIDPKEIGEESLWRLIKQKNFDVFGIPEANLNWSKLRGKQRFEPRYRERFEQGHIKTITAHNKLEKHINSRGLHGGTVQISTNQAAFRVIKSGTDPWELGRWCWQLLQGRQGKLLRVITAYRPIIKRKSSTKSSAAQQRKAMMDVFKRDAKPRTAFLTDLTKEILQWQAQGEQIIVLIDANGPLNKTHIQRFTDDCQLKDVIIERHHQKPQQWTQRDGTKPIDAIFTSLDISAIHAGYLPLNKGVIAARADHRCLWVDLDTSSIFGHLLPPLARYPQRRLKLQDPRIVQAFNKHYENFILDNKLLEKALKIEESTTFPMSDELFHQAEQLDRLKQEGIKYADQRCRHIYMGGTPYSDKFMELSDRINLWTNLMRRKMKKRVNPHYLTRLARKAKCIEQLKHFKRLTQEQTQQQLDAINQEFNQFKQDNGPEKARSDWLRRLAQARAEHELAMKDPTFRPPRYQRLPPETEEDYNNYDSQQTIIKKRTSQQLLQLRRIEDSRSKSRAIQASVGKAKLEGASRVEDIDSNGNPIILTDKLQIEDSIIRANKRKFHLAKHTPFMQHPLLQDFGYTGTGYHAQQVLNGEYIPPPDTDPYATKLLKQMKQVQGSTPLPVGISTQEWIQGWKKCKERTSAGPSQIHFGHCKASVFSPSIAMFEATMTSIPFKGGRPYSRWKIGTDVELKKKGGSINVSKLRTIVLFEADFNFGNKAIGKKIAQAAECNKGFADEQYGSRRKHSAIEHALNKQLTLDLLRFQRRPGILCANDLQSCYDRIVHSVASLCLQRQGLSESEVTCMFSTLQDLEHHIRTAYGDSDTTYGGDHWIVPMQGIYQGNGAGPIIWAVISSPLLEILKKEGYGTAFKACIDGEKIRLVGYAFVDDTDFIQTGNPGDSTQSIVDKMQQCLDTWEGLVRATGGALIIEKSAWWLIDVQWDAFGNWKYKTIDDFPATLHARDWDGTTQPLKRKDMNTAFETLGVWMAPNGQQDEAFKILKTTAETWATKLQKAFLPHDTAFYAWLTTILKTLEYPLPVLMLSKKQCRHLNFILKKVALPKSGLVRSFPNAIIHAPPSRLGCGVPDLYATQVGWHVQMLMHHGERDNLTGQLLRSSLQAISLEIGLGGSIFTHDFGLLGHLTTLSWIKCVWKELSTSPAIDLTVHYSQLTLSRTNDAFLMDLFLSQGFRNQPLRTLNRCRIYLQVYTLSDITSADGKYILQHIWKGTRHQKPCQNDVDWPEQGNMPDSAWALWRRALRKIGCDLRTKLWHQPLGPWTCEAPPHWNAFYDTTSHLLWFKHQSSWQSYSQQLSQSLHSRATEWKLSPSPFSEPPPSSERAIAWVEPNGHIYVSGQTKTTILDTPSPDPLWYREFCSNWEETADIAEGIANGTTVAVIDGSFKTKKGTAGLTFQNTATGTEITCAHRTPGPSHRQGPYRSEVTGIYGVMRTAQDICDKHNITHGSLPIGCDCTSAGITSIQHHEFPSNTSPNSDVLRAAFHLKAQLPISFSYQHIQAHRREKGLALNDWEELNDSMDSLAKAYWEHTANQPTSDVPLYPTEWILRINGDKVTESMAKTTKQGIALYNLTQWYSSTASNKITPEQWDLIHWEALAKASSSWTVRDRLWRAKFAARKCPTAINMKRWGFWTNDLCPLCGATQETTQHLLQCQSTSASEARNKHILIFQAKLEKWNTSPTLLAQLLQEMNAWLSPSDRQTTTYLPSTVEQQQTIGWHNFWSGLISKEWQTLQERYLLSKGNFHVEQRALKWSSLLIIQITEFVQAMWANRNEYIHSKDRTPQQIEEHLSVDRKIRRLWAKGPEKMFDQDRIQFMGGTSLDTLLHSSLDYKRSWVGYVKAARRFWKDEMRKQGRYGGRHRNA